MAPNSAKPKLLITGATGGLAQSVVQRLAREFHLIGVDPRPLKFGQHFPGDFYLIDYRQRKMAELFRTHTFQALVHLGRVPVTAKARASTRYNLNVLGTRNLLELALKYKLRNVVVCSTFHVYGAHQHNHLYISEEDPLRASQVFPELSDAVELDNVSTTFLLKHPEIVTQVLRPVNIIGPRIRNTVSKILRARNTPTLLGYDPLQQFIHEDDLAEAIALCVEQGQKSGVYNVAGEGVVPFSKAIEAAGSRAIPIPHFLGYPLVGVLERFGFHFPMHLLDYFRYPTILSDAAFRKAYGFSPRIPTIEALRTLAADSN